MSFAVACGAKRTTAKEPSLGALASDGPLGAPALGGDLSHLVAFHAELDDRPVVVGQLLQGFLQDQRKKQRDNRHTTPVSGSFWRASIRVSGLRLTKRSQR